MKKQFVFALLAILLLGFTRCQSVFALTTLPATGIGRTSATLHGRLDDDGGNPCECRFAISGPDGDIYTSWVGPYESGERFSAGISGLTPTTEYGFSAQARWIDDPNVSAQGNTRTFVTLGSRPVASFTYDPENPMVGGQIEFDASDSYDPDGTIVGYEWDFGDEYSESITVPEDSYVFGIPDVYTVTLTVTDNDGLTNSTSKDIDLSLKNGDVLLVRSHMSLVPGFWTHAGIYNKTLDRVIEARPDPYGVNTYPLTWIIHETHSVTCC